MPLPLALISWLVIGLVAGLLAARLLPGPRHRRYFFDPMIGLAGAIFGGVLATALGFGGLVGYDHRSLAAATLSSMFVLLLYRGFRQPA